MKKCIPVIIIAALCLLFSFQGCTKVSGDKVVTIGSKSFTEQYIVGNIMTMLLEEDGFRVQERFGVGSMIARQGLLTRQLDMYAEYTGTAWTLYQGHDEKVTDPKKLYRQVKQEDMKKHGLVWLEMTGVNNTYALAIRSDDGKKYGTTLSDLARYVNTHDEPVIFGIAHEFYHRPDGFKKMLAHYNMKIDEADIKTMDIGLSFESISRDQIDVAMVYSTDGKLKKYNLLVLEDDRKFFPIYTLCVVTHMQALEKYPEIPRILRPLTIHLDNETMQELNYQVDALGKPSKLVADKFLREKGLIR